MSSDFGTYHRNGLVGNQELIITSIENFNISFEVAKK